MPEGLRGAYIKTRPGIKNGDTMTATDPRSRLRLSGRADRTAHAFDLQPDAGDHFPAPGPVPSEPPWFEDVWVEDPHDASHC